MNGESPKRTASKIDELLKARAAVEEELRRHQSHISVLFTDVVGSTSYFERYGNIAGLAMVTRYADLASEVVTEYHGRAVKTIGDSVMAEFAEAAQAVRAAVEIQRRLLRKNETQPERDRLQLRIGIHHGPCFRESDDLYGEGVNGAARVTKRTGPAQILISRAVRDSLPPDMSVRCNRVGEITGEQEPGKEAARDEVFEVVWTDTITYTDIRHHTTIALKRGELLAPGLRVEDLVQPSPPVPPGHTTQPIPPPSGAVVTPSRETSLASRYEILGELGAGGMGMVYKARDRETGDVVALKVLRSEIAADAEGMSRFKHELRVTRKITHKNVCRIHEFNRTEDSAYISMEYVEGESLRHILTRFGSMSPRKGIQIAQQICAGLHEAHSQGIVHRDLKPENVMIDQAGNVKLMDFGIARSTMGLSSTAVGAVIGTPAYMAPEQARGVPVDHRADIYSLGLILYEMFTGTRAFQGKTPVEVMFKQLSDTPTPPRQIEPTLPLHIELAIIRCLEKDPANRFQSVDELQTALAGKLEERPLAAPPVPTPPPAVTPADRTTAGFPAPLSTPPAVAAPPALAAAAVPIPSPAQLTPQPAPMVTTPQPVAAVTAKPSPAKGLMLVAVAALVVIAVAGGYYLKFMRKPVETQQTQVAAPAIVQPQPASQPTAQAQQQPLSSAAAQPGAEPAPPVREKSAPPEKSATAPTNAPPTTPAQPAAKPAAEPQLALPVATPSRPLPDYSFARTLAGHTSAVAAVAFSADGRLLASAGSDKTVRIWEVGSGQAMQVLKGHTGSVTCVAFSPDGHIVASSSLDRTVKLWDAAGGREAGTLPKDASGVLAVAFSPNGRLLATANQQGTVKVFEVASGTAVQNIEAHSGPVFSIAFSPDGRLLASAGRDQQVKLWQVSSGEAVRSLSGHSDAVNRVAFSPDGRILASASEDRTVKLWDVASGRELRTLSGHTSGVGGVAFSADGHVLASGAGDKVLKLWEVSSGREIKSLTGHVFGILSVAASRDGRWLASSAGDNSVRLWRRE